VDDGLGGIDTSPSVAGPAFPDIGAAAALGAMARAAFVAASGDLAALDALGDGEDVEEDCNPGTRHLCRELG
jgi:hypothetical protein